MTKQLTNEQIDQIKALLADHGLTVRRQAAPRKANAQTRRVYRVEPDWLKADNEAQEAYIKKLQTATGWAKTRSIKAACIKTAKSRLTLSLGYRAFILGRDARPYALAEKIVSRLNGKVDRLALPVDKTSRRVAAFNKQQAAMIGSNSDSVIYLPH